MVIPSEVLREILSLNELLNGRMSLKPFPSRFGVGVLITRHQQTLAGSYLKVCTTVGDTG